MDTIKRNIKLIFGVLGLIGLIRITIPMLINPTPETISKGIEHVGVTAIPWIMGAIQSVATLGNGLLVSLIIIGLITFYNWSK